MAKVNLNTMDFFASFLEKRLKEEVTHEAVRRLRKKFIKAGKQCAEIIADAIIDQYEIEINTKLDIKTDKRINTVVFRKRREKKY